MAIATFLGLLYLALIVDTWRRRGRYPPLIYGGRVVADRHQRRIWLGVFSVFFAVAMVGVGTTDVVHSETWEGAATPRLEGHGGRSTITNRGGPALYTYSIRETSLEDGSFSGVRTEVARIPWLMLIAAALYWWEVVLRSKRDYGPERAAVR